MQQTKYHHVPKQAARCPLRRISNLEWSATISHKNSSRFECSAYGLQATAYTYCVLRINYEFLILRVYLILNSPAPAKLFYRYHVQCAQSAEKRKLPQGNAIGNSVKPLRYTLYELVIYLYFLLIALQLHPAGASASLCSALQS